MTLVTWLKIFIIGLPLVGVVTIWWVANKWLDSQRPQLAVIFSSVAGLVALTLFFVNGYPACIVASGAHSCLWEGLATILLILGGLGAAIKYRADYIPGRPSHEKNYTTLLLMSAWAGMNFFENLLLVLISWLLVLHTIYRWCKENGFQGGFLVIRDDYKDN